MVELEPTQSSSAKDTCITALQGAPEGLPEQAVPTNILKFKRSLQEVVSYMEQEPDGEQLVMTDVTEADECLELEDASQAAFWDQVGILNEKEEDVEMHELDDNGNPELKCGNSTVNFPMPPADWTAPPPKAEAGEPVFTSVDNPGSWSEFVFHPTFFKGNKKKKLAAKYSHHAHFLLVPNQYQRINMASAY